PPWRGGRPGTARPAAVPSSRNSASRSTVRSWSSRARAPSRSRRAHWRESAERLGRAYWREVRRVTCSLVRPRQRGSALELRVLGGPVLLRFGAPTVEADDTRAT